MGTNENNTTTVTGVKRSRTIEVNNDEDTYTDIDDETLMKNLCTECNVDMGDCNPRQLCGKTRCLQSKDDGNVGDEDDEKHPQKKKKNAFLSIEDFTQKAEKAKPTKWVDLDRTKIFRVIGIEEFLVNQERDGVERIAKVGEFEDSLGDIIRCGYLV